MDFASPKQTSPQKKTKPSGQVLDVLAAGALAWAIPGLGHCLCGCRRHGLVVGLVIGTLWAVGLAVGGFSVVDARPAPTGQRGWFYAQAGVGASVWVEHAHAAMREIDQEPELALGRGREVATLYLAAAGLLNMMAIADAMLRASKPKAQVAPVDEALPTDKEAS